MEVVPVSAATTKGLFWVPANGGCAMTTIVKLTFTLQQGDAELAPRQEPIFLTDQHYGDNPNASLRAPSDLVPFKTRADVLLVGHAFAPEGSARRSITMRLGVGTLDKRVEIFADRHFTQEGELVEDTRLTKVALRWELARGGSDTANPIGIARDAPRDRYGRIKLPNLQPPGGHVASPTDTIGVIGVGPIAPGWSPRARLLGRHAQTFNKDWNARPLPTDIDRSFFNSAPMDQRLERIREDETLVLDMLHPIEQSLVCKLPGTMPVAFVERGQDAQPLDLKLDTLLIDTDRLVVTLTWRGTINLESPSEPGRVLVAVKDGRGIAPGYHDVARLAALVDRSRDGADNTSDIDDEVTGAFDVSAIGDQALPFMQSMDGTEAISPMAEKRQSKLASKSPFAGQTVGEGEIQKAIEGARQSAGLSPSWLREDTSPPPAASEPAQLGAGVGEPSSPWASAQRTPAVTRQGLPPAVARPAMPAPSPPNPMPANPMPPHRPSTPGMPAVSPAPPMARPLPPNPIASQPPQVVEPEPAPPPVQKKDADKRPRRSPTGQLIKLVWFDEEAKKKIHAADLVDEEAEDVDPEEFDFFAEPPPEVEAADLDRRRIVEMVTMGRVTAGASVRTVMLESVADDGSFEPPVIIVAGRLSFPFDEMETLRATLAAVMPFVPGNPKLEQTVKTTEELMATDWLKTSGEMAMGQVDKIRDAFKGTRDMDVHTLDRHTKRVLLEGRAYQRRTIFGDECIRALLRPSMSDDLVPTYLPDELSKELPMFESFEARLVVEAHPKEDQYEPHDTSFLALAVGRVIRLGPGS